MFVESNGVGAFQCGPSCSGDRQAGRRRTGAAPRRAGDGSGRHDQAGSGSRGAAHALAEADGIVIRSGTQLTAEVLATSRG